MEQPKSFTSFVSSFNNLFEDFKKPSVILSHLSALSLGGLGGFLIGKKIGSKFQDKEEDQEEVQKILINSQRTPSFIVNPDLVKIQIEPAPLKIPLAFQGLAPALGIPDLKELENNAETTALDKLKYLFANKDTLGSVRIWNYLNSKVDVLKEYINTFDLPEPKIGDAFYNFLPNYTFPPNLYGDIKGTNPFVSAFTDIYIQKHQNDINNPEQLRNLVYMMYRLVAEFVKSESKNCYLQHIFRPNIWSSYFKNNASGNPAGHYSEKDIKELYDKLINPEFIRQLHVSPLQE